MDEPIYSPDGNFIWDGGQWVPTTSHNKLTVNMQDSVIGGDVVSNTNIQSSDAEVIKAAMEGVVASIRELNKPQIATENPPLVAEENTEPAVVFVPAPHFPVPEQVSKSPIPIPPKKILVAVSIVGLLLITTVLTVLFLGEDDESHPIEGRWYMIGPPENEYIETTKRNAKLTSERFKNSISKLNRLDIRTITILRDIETSAEKKTIIPAFVGISILSFLYISLTVTPFSLRRRIPLGNTTKVTKKDIKKNIQKVIIILGPSFYFFEGILMQFQQF